MARLGPVASGAAYASTSVSHVVGQGRHPPSPTHPPSLGLGSRVLISSTRVRQLLDPRHAWPLGPATSWWVHGSRRCPWPTTHQAPGALPPTLQGPMFLDRRDRIATARRLESTSNSGLREPRGEALLVEADTLQQHPGRHLFRGLAGQVPTQSEKQRHQDHGLGPPSSRMARMAAFGRPSRRGAMQEALGRQVSDPAGNKVGPIRNDHGHYPESFDRA
jgi:hypothetical protein